MPAANNFNNPEVKPRIPLHYLTWASSLPVPAFVCDSAGLVLSRSEAAAALFGRGLAVGNKLSAGPWKFFHPDGRPLPFEETPMSRFPHASPTKAREIVLEQETGRRFHLLPHVQPLYDDQGEMVGRMNLFVDITESINAQHRQRSQSEQAHDQSEERYQRMVSEIQDYAVVLLSREGIVENWNAGARDIKGYTEQEAIGRHFESFFSEEDRTAGLPQRLLQQAAQDGKAACESWSIRKDGSRFWQNLSVSALHNRNFDVIGYSMVSRDLSEKLEQERSIRKFNEDLRQKNELLRESEERYHRMIAEVEDYVIILLDCEGRIQNWNRGAEKIKGYTAGEIVGQHITIFYSEEDRRNGMPTRLLKQAAEKGKAIHEGWRVRKGGSRFWGSVVLTAIHNAHGGLIGFTKVTRDLTAKKITEEKLLATSRTLEQKNQELERINRDLSSFAYISSHDLQEPLRKIQTFADRIVEMEYDNLSEKGKDYFRRMQGGAARMQKLIRDILAYSRATTVEKTTEVTDLNQVIRQVRTEFEDLILQKKAVIASDDLPALHAIPHQMQQLFNNLLNNALKFSKPDEAPRINIRCERISGDRVDHEAASRQETYYYISVQDNGIGFDPRYTGKIFEVFQRLHTRSDYEGTGIGLAICKRIVENHHGFIDADSAPGRGTTFHVYLPATPPAALTVSDEAP